MTYNELSDDDKAILKNYLQMARPLAGEFGKMLTKAGAVKTSWDTLASAVVAKLDANEVIPNETGLAGAVALTKEEIQGLETAVESAITNYESPTNRALYVKSAGAENTI